MVRGTRHPALFQQRKEEFLFGLRNTPNTPSQRNPTPADFIGLLRSEYSRTDDGEG
jgi:hypothetical protein